MRLTANNKGSDMSVITPKIKKDYNVPQLCEQCDSPAVIWWMLHCRVTEQVRPMSFEFTKTDPDEENTVINLGFCERHAQELVMGIQRDINELIVGKTAADTNHRLLRERMSLKP